MFLLIVFALVAIGFSFLCSILEAALLSITPSYIAGLKGERPKLFEKLRKLKDDIDDPLAAILTLNTIAHTAGATGVGAQVAVIFGEAYLGAASAVMTLAILILSEIIPKTIGAKFWRTLAP
ncbi:MAG TPA: hemolysin, partial [Alcanivorax sp.]|nr:hemolysin [Alcanivorax sp.]